MVGVLKLVQSTKTWNESYKENSMEREISETKNMEASKNIKNIIEGLEGELIL